MGLDPEAAFTALPETLVEDLLSSFRTVVTNYGERRWEPAELNGGKLCEAAYTIVLGYLSNSYPARASKPKNMFQACLNIEKQFTTGSRSPRIQIPRMIIGLYEIRNNRGVGHAGGDVNPNEMDATAVLYMSKWLMAELVRIIHTVSLKEATDIVEQLVERQIALIWTYGDKRRVLKAGLSWKQNVLLLLVGVAEASDSDLVAWLEHNNPSNLRRDVLRPMHKARLLEYDEDLHSVRLLPPGIEQAEELIRKLSRQT